MCVWWWGVVRNTIFFVPLRLSRCAFSFLCRPIISSCSFLFFFSLKSLSTIKSEKRERESLDF